MFPYLLLAACILVGSVGQLFMKSGMAQVGEISSVGALLNPHTVWSMVTNIRVVGGLLFEVMAVFLWLGALSSLDVSVMYPLTSLGIVLAALLALVFLGEHVSALRWTGIALVASGSFLILSS